MNTPDYNDIDRLFQDQLSTYEVDVVNRDNLWRRIKPNRGSKKYLFLLFISLVGSVGLMFTMLPPNEGSGGGADGLLGTSGIMGNESKKLKSETLSSWELSQESAELVSIDIQKKERTKLEKQAYEHESPLEKVIVKQPKEKYSQSIIKTNRTAAVDITRAAPERGLVLENSMSENLESSLEENDELQVEGGALELEHVSGLTTLNAPFNLNPLRSKKPFNYLMDFQKNPLNKCVVGSSDGGLYIDVFSSVLLPLDQVSLNTGFVDQTMYQETWSERNSSLLALAGGLAVGYEFANGLDVSVGIEYQKLESQYQYTQTINEVTTVWDPMAYFFVDDQGQTVWVADSVTAINRYDRRVSIGSTTTFINVPVQVSYPLLRKGKWEVKASLAGILNLQMQNVGQILREDLTLTAVDDTNESTFFRSNIGLSYELGAHFGYHFGGKMEVYVSPRFRYNSKSLLVDSTTLSLKRNFVGLRMGAQYHF